MFYIFSISSYAYSIILGERGNLYKYLYIQFSYRKNVIEKIPRGKMKFFVGKKSKIFIFPSKFN